MAISKFILLVWTLIFCSTFNAVSGSIQFDFRVTPSVVQPLETENMTLQCFVTTMSDYSYNYNNGYYYNQWGQYVPNPPPTGDDKSGIAMIRILKNFQSQWQPIAEISSVARTTVHQLDASISSSEGSITELASQQSFIQVAWDVATIDAYGSYRCDVISFDTRQNAILTTSSELSIGASLNPIDLVRLFYHYITGVQRTLDDLEENQRSYHNLTEELISKQQTLEEQTGAKQNELDGKISQQGDLLRGEIDRLGDRIDDLDNQVSNKLDEINSKTDLIFDSSFLMLWPRGSYGLLQPESGCPAGGATSWQSGSIRHHTESTDQNKNELSPETHLKQPVQEKVGANTFLNQHFCVKTSGNSLGPSWRKGSYCLNKKGSCPTRFDEGYIRWTEEERNTNRTSRGSLPDGIFNGTGITTIGYCCRKDGPTDVPIYLPNSDPFYLYRYGGRCQQVHDMTVTEEFVLFDTENRISRDEVGKVHPDGKIKNVRLELCYYSRI